MAERCIQCGSERVVPKAVVWDQTSGGSLMAYVCAKPDAAIFKGAAYATLYARICADCGHTSLFAEGAEALDAQLVRIALERHAVPVGVAEDEGARDAGEVVEDGFGPDVPAVNKELRPLPAQYLHGGGHRLDAVVGVTQNADAHRR